MPLQMSAGAWQPPQMRAGPMRRPPRRPTRSRRCVTRGWACAWPTWWPWGRSRRWCRRWPIRRARRRWSPRRRGGGRGGPARPPRGVLHDDVLPRLHTAMLTLPPANKDALALLGEVHRQIADLLHALPATAAPEVARLGLIGALRRALADDL